jgi:hypothetical protein
MDVRTSVTTGSVRVYSISNGLCSVYRPLYSATGDTNRMTRIEIVFLLNVFIWDCSNVETVDQVDIRKLRMTKFGLLCVNVFSFCTKQKDKNGKLNTDIRRKL